MTSSTHTTSEAAGERGIEPKPPTPPRTCSAHGMIHRLHTIAGLFVAPLLLVAALTGLLYSVAPTLEQIVYRDVLTAESPEQNYPVGSQIEIAQRVKPDLNFSAVEVPEQPGQTTRVLFDDPSLPSSSYRQAVFVDPSNLTVTGNLVQYGSAQALPLRAWISEGHRRLWLGEPGRVYSETAASWLGILALAGAWLWWRRRQRHKGKSTTGMRKRALSWHSALGIWLLPGFLFLTATGLTWSLVAGANIGEVRSQLNWTEPTPAVTVSEGSGAESAAGTHAHHGHVMELPAEPVAVSEVDTVISAARSAGLTGMIDVNAPTAEGGAWTVKESRQAYKLANDSVSVDGATGEIVDRVDYNADWPLAAKLSNWLIQLHMGTLFGPINQLVLAVIAVGLIAVICFGYRMWWLRGRGNRPGRLPAAGQWRRVHPAVLAGIVLFLLAYAVVAPLFGISLVLFLLVDVVWQRLRRRKQGAGARPGAGARVSGAGPE
ncbi:PepSY-associated TM helix domain-containing protein [Corynebacterium halotolerans]|uniref:PepSY-associated TM helix domain-containing protein n=1 Tax=Corynebacterium halotolerans TaxID=225326 RepID=UPI003CEE4F98